MARGINADLERCYNLHSLNQKCLEKNLADLDMWLKPESSLYWLMTARIVEGSLLCAGHYADHAEYKALGDILVNLQATPVYFAHGIWDVKSKPEASTDDKPQQAEMYSNMENDSRFVFWPVDRTSLLFFLYHRLQNSALISSSYLQSVENRMQQLGNTLNFWWTWGVEGAEEVFKVQQLTTPERLKFIKQNLCRFQPDLFLALGEFIYDLCRRHSEKAKPTWSQ